ncbi:DUF4097 family beta strand repeat-containing protein [Luteipulveratus sp. YIM 133132]|uniref:DUF4097 family beta strand repeat-containing protein n=1 Tax=Luteipulveratus flavus TaxID=3031728 RepID=UPI0023B02062|nr:DUF4097 family beta strand repeat-containing protein [Luteipulveratus sp. YIM 133132]MDE9365164.1 DUF4097 family beta strand repeat-containing protein [Luteipulveratus sp. YIM 133132]
MPEYIFETPEPVELFVEIGGGKVDVVAEDTGTTRVEVEGDDADDVTVTQDGRHVRVVGPKGRRVRLGFVKDLRVSVVVPSGSDAITRTGSADVQLTGEYGSGRFSAGSGRVTVPTFTGSVEIDTGSGRATVAEVGGALRSKTGSGELEVGSCGGDASVSAGSGGVRVGVLHGALVLKAGSGHVELGQVGAETTVTTGSGDITVGRIARGSLSARGGSGDIQVGVPAGTPVWTDISTGSGRLRNQLASVGEPEPGQEHVELRLGTGSGDVLLRQAQD